MLNLLTFNEKKTIVIFNRKDERDVIFNSSTTKAGVVLMNHKENYYL